VKGAHPSASPHPGSRPGSRAMAADFVELLVASGVVDALASLFALHDRPKAAEEVGPVPPAIRAGLRLLEALLDARAPPLGRELPAAGLPAGGGAAGTGGAGGGPGGGGGRGGRGTCHPAGGGRVARG
jgi:hypothetical protein